MKYFCNSIDTHSGLSDKEMAKRLNVTEVFNNGQTAETEFVPIHNHAVSVDDRYLTTEKEKQHIIDTFFGSLHPLKLKTFSTKEKNKIIILGKIAEQFEPERQYSEKEVNQVLKLIYEDHITLRRYLIMYGFLKRTDDGASYWVAD